MTLVDIVEQQIKLRNQYLRNLVDLFKLEVTYLQKVVGSLPNRIQAIVKSRGGIALFYVMRFMIYLAVTHFLVR